MIQSYKKRPELQDRYDAIFIGSGIGCLTAGAILAKEGKKVLILERHYTAGGYTHVFKRRGYEWDVGIHYIGEVGRPNSAIRRLFDYITDNKLEWADMGEVYDRIIVGDKQYDFVKGVQNWKDKLKGYFPGEEKAIDAYVDHVFAATSAAGKFFMVKALPNIAAGLLGGSMQRSYLKYAGQTTYEVLRGLTDNEDLIKVLTGQYGDYGLPPRQSSFAMHASVAKHYFHGGNFPVGGSGRIVETIDPVIEASGGTILTNAEVDEVIIERNRAKGVRMADGKTFQADLIVSGTGIVNTYEKLIPESVSRKHGFMDQLEKVKPSVAHGCLYIGLTGSPDELKLPKTNLWIYPDDLDHDGSVDRYLKDPDAPFPVVYVSFPSAKDPSWSQRYPGRSTIDIITLLPWETVQQWAGSRWMKRGYDYDAMKEEISQRLLEHLFAHLPHLRDRIDHSELSTPLTTQHFCNYAKGELYGIDHTPDRYRQKFLKPRTPIKGFWLTGQDIVTAGVGGALFAGLLTASAIAGKNFMKKIYR
jgi:all-trans-retinol 13,14-reductase